MSFPEKKELIAVLGFLSILARAIIETRSHNDSREQSRRAAEDAAKMKERIEVISQRSDAAHVKIEAVKRGRKLSPEQKACFAAALRDADLSQLRVSVTYLPNTTEGPELATDIADLLRDVSEGRIDRTPSEDKTSYPQPRPPPHTGTLVFFKTSSGEKVAKALAGCIEESNLSGESNLWPMAQTDVRIIVGKR